MRKRGSFSRAAHRVATISSMELIVLAISRLRPSLSRQLTLLGGPEASRVESILMRSCAPSADTSALREVFHCYTRIAHRYQVITNPGDNIPRSPHNAEIIRVNAL